MVRANAARSFYSGLRSSAVRVFVCHFRTLFSRARRLSLRRQQPAPNEH
jgi:hypothetical protein